MRALVYTAPQSLEMREVAEPSGDVVIDVESAGVCGSDMHAFLGHDARRPAPLILGHEIAGTTADGRRVTVNPLVACGTCPACGRGQDNLCPDRRIISMPPCEGGFAERIAMPEANLVTVPDHVSPDSAALAEPIACGWHAVRLAHRYLDGPAERTLVFGGGAIGVGAALCALAQGAGAVTVVEPNATRRDYLSERTGLHVVERAEGAYDAVVDGVGIEATRLSASALARPGGVIAHIGLGGGAAGLDVRRMTLQEIAFIGTYTYTARDFRDTAEAMWSGRLGALDWTEARPLSEGPQAFADIRAGRTAVPKIILKPRQLR